MMLSTTMTRVKLNLESASNFPASVFGTFAGVPPSSMTASLRGAHRFDAETEARMLALSLRLVEVINALHPLTVAKGAWEPLLTLMKSEKSADEIRTLVNALFDGASTQEDFEQHQS